MTQELKHHSFRNKVDLSPGEQSKLTKQVVDRAPSRYQKVSIDRIEYSDGSKWQRSESK